MKLLKKLMLLCVVTFVYSCTTPVVKPVKWNLQKEGIVLHLKADKKLNSESGSEKPLNLIVYQLKSPFSFTALSEDKKGIYTLLKSKLFSADVASVQKIKVPPGSEAMYRLDRLEGVSHVGVVAGYDSVERGKMTRLFAVPVYVKKDGPFSSTGKLVPGILDIKVNLGSDSIVKRMRIASQKETKIPI